MLKRRGVIFVVVNVRNSCCLFLNDNSKVFWGCAVFLRRENIPEKSFLGLVWIVRNRQKQPFQFVTPEFFSITFYDDKSLQNIRCLNIHFPNKMRLLILSQTRLEEKTFLFVTPYEPGIFDFSLLIAEIRSLLFQKLNETPDLTLLLLLKLLDSTVSSGV